MRSDDLYAEDFDPAALHRQRELAELADEFAGVWSPETIERFVDECREQLEQRGAVRGINFLGVRACNFARERLLALAQAEGRVPKRQPEVLYVCVHNAGRSQIAAALTHHLSEGRVSVRSAGSQPSAEVAATVVEAMAEIGVDVTEAFPKPLTDEVVQAADAVITMGCGDACPVYPGKRYEDWAVLDPEGKPIETVRAIRDDIADRVRTLIGELTLAPAS